VYRGTAVADIEEVVYGYDLRRRTGAEDFFEHRTEETGEKEGEEEEEVSCYTCSNGAVAWVQWAVYAVIILPGAVGADVVEGFVVLALSLSFCHWVVVWCRCGIRA
jgi:hypothetical protein